MISAAIIAALWTIPLFACAVGEEPFVGDFNVIHWLIMFVGGGLGVLFWVIWSLMIIYAAFRRWWPLPTVLLLLVAIRIGYAQYFCLTVYLADRQNWFEPLW